MLEEVEKKFQPLFWLAAVVGSWVGAFVGWGAMSTMAWITLEISRLGGCTAYIIVFTVLSLIVGTVVRKDRQGAIIGAIIGLLWAGCWVFVILNWARALGFAALGGSGILLFSVCIASLCWWLVDLLFQTIVLIVEEVVKQAKKNPS